MDLNGSSSLSSPLVSPLSSPIFSPIFSPLTLPCGVVIKNRLAKSAMSENLADSKHQATVGHQHLYQRWAIGGMGLSITGNVMVDSRHLGEPGNVVIEDETTTTTTTTTTTATTTINLQGLTDWARAGGVNNTSLWVQLNHPGKQSPKFINSAPVAPSVIPLKPPMDKLFITPRELREDEIKDIIERFGKASRIVQLAGFAGVQIHGAHGYLVSQFLSPHHNRRTDRFGGSLENRMRFVVEIYQSIRRNVGANFPIGIKINSSDFQRGGFSEEDSETVVCKLAELGIDLIEISGGNYESPTMVGGNGGGSGSSSLKTRDREAYFLQFAKKIRQKTAVPLMVTGGIRSRLFMEQALQENSLDFIGLARPFAINPDFALHLAEGSGQGRSQVIPRTTGIKMIDKMVMLEITWYTQQLKRMALQQEPNPSQSNWNSILKNLVHYGWQIFRRTRSH